MYTQMEKAERFRDLHQRKQILLLPNPWDAGSAKLLAALGFEALATTSAGLAFSLGKRDGEGAVSREEALANASSICKVADLPVSGDLENGYGPQPSDCAHTVIAAAEAGLVGCSIEDASGNPSHPIYSFEQSVKRVEAAVQSARSLHFPFTLTARAENFLHGINDLEDTIRRLQAYAEAGADVVYAPALKTRADIEAVVKAVSPKPVNVLGGMANFPFSISELGEMGVKRVSLGSAFSRVAYSAFLRGAEEWIRTGHVQFISGSISLDEMNERMK